MGTEVPGCRIYAAPGAPQALLDLAEKRLGLRAEERLPGDGELVLRVAEDGISLAKDGCRIQGDFTRMRPRLLPPRLNGELLIKAAKGKGRSAPMTAVDATAGLGEDAFLLAAYGYRVELYERNPVIALLLEDALLRAAGLPDLAPIAARMELHGADSVAAMRQAQASPDVILLDPMFPERKKSGLIKKKFQLLHCLEQPCEDEAALLQAAIGCAPQKIIIKRPKNSPPLAGHKPSYTVSGQSIRYDCIVRGA